MVQRWQGLSTSAWQQASSNAWLHQLPQHQLQHVVVAAQRSASAASSSSTSSSGEAAGKPAYNKKQRLDDYCLQQYPSYSKNLVQSWIAQGKVLVNDKVVTKAGHAVPKNAAVRINAEEPKYVCRAGFKLKKALDHFHIDVTGATALDSGLSTGGFTHCLLQRGARHVYGVDVGHGQVMGSIAQDPRVTVMERINLRHLKPEQLPEQVTLVTLDLSFISVLKVMPALAAVMAPGAQMVVLIKPQFEAGRAQVGTGGLVKDSQLVKEVINPDAQITYQENTADDPSRRRPDITKMRNKYGWEPRIPLKDGLLRMVEDFKRRLHVQ